MAIRNAENFEQALQRAVLARPAVEEVESDLGFRRRESCGDVRSDVDPGDAVAEPVQRVGTSVARSRRYFALGRPASHQDGNVFGHALPGCLQRLDF